MKNSGDNVFDGIPVGDKEPSLFVGFLAAHDFGGHTRRVTVGRVTLRDIVDLVDGLFLVGLDVDVHLVVTLLHLDAEG